MDRSPPGRSVWHRLHQHELEATWELAKRNQATGTIQGLP